MILKKFYILGLITAFTVINNTHGMVSQSIAKYVSRYAPELSSKFSTVVQRYAVTAAKNIPTHVFNSKLFINSKPSKPQHLIDNAFWQKFLKKIKEPIYFHGAIASVDSNDLVTSEEQKVNNITKKLFDLISLTNKEWSSFYFTITGLSNKDCIAKVIVELMSCKDIVHNWVDDPNLHSILLHVRKMALENTEITTKIIDYAIKENKLYTIFNSVRGQRFIIQLLKIDNNSHTIEKVFNYFYENHPSANLILLHEFPCNPRVKQTLISQAYSFKNTALLMGYMAECPEKHGVIYEPKSITEHNLLVAMPSIINRQVNYFDTTKVLLDDDIKMRYFPFLLFLEDLELGYVTEQCIQKEQKLHNKDYYSFLHGQNKAVFLPEFFFTQLLGHHKNIPVNKFLTIRIDKDLMSPEKPENSEKYQKFLQRGATGNNEKKLFFMNHALFAQETVEPCGESTAYFVAKNHNISSKLFSIEDCFNYFDQNELYQKYKSEIKALKKEFKELGSYGNLLVIGIPKNKIKDTVFACQPYGIKASASIIKDGNDTLTHDISTIMQKLHENSLQIRNFNELEFATPALHKKGGILDLESGFIITPIFAGEPAKVKAFKKHLKEVKQKIDAELNDQAVKQPQN